MSADYPSAQEHLVPRNFMFDSNACKAIVIHKTGGDATPQAVYNTFLASGNPGNSTHFAIGTDGTIWQFVPESLGAGGNGRTEPGYDPFWTQYVNEYGNLNLCTISIEHCDASLDNSTPLTPAQKAASFKLVAHLAQKYNIAASHIKTHASIDPVDRSHCPGNYPMDELLQFVQQGGPMTPDKWKDDGTTLTAPNGVPVRDGFRDKVLNSNWDPNNWPLAPEAARNPLEDSNHSLGGGTYQIFRMTMLEWTTDRGVFVAWVGSELWSARTALAKAQQPTAVTLNPDVIAQLLTASTALATVTAAVSKAQSELKS